MTSELVASAGIELSYIHSGIDLARIKESGISSKTHLASTWRYLHTPNRQKELALETPKTPVSATTRVGVCGCRVHQPKSASMTSKYHGLEYHDELISLC
jgi:hypothetical protein